MKSLVPFLAPLLLGGCLQEFVPLEVTRVLGVVVLRAEPEHFDLEVTLELSNPNSVGVRLSDARVQVARGGGLLGQAAAPINQIAPARGTINARVPVPVPYKYLPVELFQAGGKGLDSLTIDLTFKAVSSVGSVPQVLSVTTKVQSSFMIQRVVTLVLQGRGLTLESLRRVPQPAGAGLEAELRLTNPLPVPLTVSSSDFKLLVGGERVGRLQLEGPQAVPAGASRRLEARGQARAGQLAWNLADGASRAQAQLEGELRLLPIGGLRRVPLRRHHRPSEL